jgi:serine/threonine-protein kinase HipA
MNRCRILLTRLESEAEQTSGYSTRGMKKLTGSARVEPYLGFTRTQFVQQLPQQQQGMSISGYQPKLQLVLRQRDFAVVGYQGDYILKPSPVEFPHLAENEHATMTLMARLGFDVPAHGLLPFRPEHPDDDIEYAFVIRRFDRDREGHALHQEPLDAAMNVGEKYGKYRDDGLPWVSYQQIAQFLIQHVNDNLAFKIDLLRRIIYAYLLGNNDMHLRNFGLLHPRGAAPQLSPLYDFVSVAPFSAYFQSSYLALPLLACEEGGRELAAGFTTQYGEYLGMDFLTLGLIMGLSRKLVVALLANLLKEQQQVETTYNESFMQPEAVAAVLQCYRQRLSRLQIVDEPAL